MLSAAVTQAAGLAGPDSAPEAFGRAASADTIPKGMRRKLSALDMGVARCVIGLGEGSPAEEIVFASRYGNMTVTLDLLNALVERDLLSPARFSASVHNAAVGLATQLTLNRRAHTAIAAGANTLAAGLTEAWTRLASGEPSVMLVYADMPLMSAYAAFDEGPADTAVWLALRLTSPGRDSATPLQPGRAGALALAREAGSPPGRLSWEP